MNETTQPTTLEEILETARAENLPMKKVKSLLYHAGLPHNGAALDEIREALGREKGPSGPTEEEIAAKKEAEAKAEAERQAKIEEARRQNALREQAAAEQAAAKKQEWDAFQSDEKERLADVTPHWPTFHRVKELAAEWNEACDARMYRDVKDYQFLRHSGDALGHLLEMVDCDERSAASDIFRRTVEQGREISAAQIKLLAVIVAKLAAERGISGEQSLEAATFHRQEAATAELDEIAVDLPAEQQQYVAVEMVATKKQGKPYLALVGPTFGRRTFAKGRKFSNTSKAFRLEGLRIGDVIEWRGFNWSRESNAYEGGVEYAVVGEGALYFVSRSTARSVVESGGPLMIDRFTDVMRLHADAPVAEELNQRESSIDFRAFLTAADGRILQVAPWNCDDQDEDE